MATVATVSGQSTHSVTFTQAGPATLPGSPTVSVPEATTNKYANGTAANMVDQLYSKVLTIAISTPQTIDLTSITDPWGGAVNFARCRSIAFRNTGSNPITIGAAAANAWVGPLGTTTSTLVLPAGGAAYFEDPASLSSAGWVTGGSSKSLKVDSGAAVGTLEILIGGGSATS